MKISYNWLKQFIKIDWKSDETAALLTDLGLEVEVVEKYQSVKGGLEGIVVGHVLTCVQHPNADRLRVCQVDVGQAALLNIVCGAPNARVGIKVPCALVGAALPAGDDGKPFMIKVGKLRGVESQAKRDGKRTQKLLGFHFQSQSQTVFHQIQNRGPKPRFGGLSQTQRRFGHHPPIGDLPKQLF